MYDYVVCFVFFKQKTSDEMRISDWSSDVCSADISGENAAIRRLPGPTRALEKPGAKPYSHCPMYPPAIPQAYEAVTDVTVVLRGRDECAQLVAGVLARQTDPAGAGLSRCGGPGRGRGERSEEHTSELQSL